MYRNLSPRALGFSGTIQSEMIELALTYGFRGMDLDIVDFGQQVADFGMDHARRLIDSAKLQLGNFTLPVRISEDDASFEKDLAKLPGYAKLAAEMNCVHALTFLPPASDKVAYPEFFSLHSKRLTEVAKVLAPHGVKLAVEFLGPATLRAGKAHEFIHDLASTIKLIELIGQPNVGLLLDTWHVFTSGGSIADIKALDAKHIVSVQVSDLPLNANLEQLQDLDRKLPGETGVAHIPEVLMHLQKIGYDGPVTPEPLKQRMKGMGRQRAVKMVGDAMMQVWKLADLPLGLRAVTVPPEEE